MCVKKKKKQNLKELFLTMLQKHRHGSDSQLRQHFSTAMCGGVKHIDEDKECNPEYVGGFSHTQLVMTGIKQAETNQGQHTKPGVSM